MRERDVEELDGLLSLAEHVIPLREVDAHTPGSFIALRHDVDDNKGSLDAAVRIAAWEHVRGYRSTFFMLHTAYYWSLRETPAKFKQIAALGHEIGIHANAIVQGLQEGTDPAACLQSALLDMDTWGMDVVGVAPHGDSACYARDGSLRFINDEMFEECQRPELGPLAERLPWLKPRRLEEFGLSYDAYRIPKGYYLSDSGDRWTPSIGVARQAFEGGLDAPLQILQHPDWYREAL